MPSRISSGPVVPAVPVAERWPDASRPSSVSVGGSRCDHGLPVPARSGRRQSRAVLIERSPDSLFLLVAEASLPGLGALVLIGKRVSQGVLQWSRH